MELHQSGEKFGHPRILTVDSLCEVQPGSVPQFHIWKSEGRRSVSASLTEFIEDNRMKSAIKSTIYKLSETMDEFSKRRIGIFREDVISSALEPSRKAQFQRSVIASGSKKYC